MQKKRLLITAIVLALLGLLIYTQFREWRNFDWPTFWAQTHQVRGIHILHGIALIYLHYGLRALRWHIFLKPLKKENQSSWVSLIPPTVIGFTGLALLGRPGEFIRPYLIARREGLCLSSQIAVWTVERIFDLGAFTSLMVAAIFFSKGLRMLSLYAKFRDAGFVLMAGVAGLALVAVIVAKNGNRLADWAEMRLGGFRLGLGKKVATKIREFGLGLHTVNSLWSFVQLSSVSVAMWYLIALAYREVTHAYPIAELHHLTTSKVLLLMGSSMVGSMVQLPAVGGGSQVATISALSAIFNVPKESAVSCGMLLWLVTFMSVVPLGLALAHRAHLSLRQLSKESSQAGAAAEGAPATI